MTKKRILFISAMREEMAPLLAQLVGKRNIRKGESYTAEVTGAVYSFYVVGIGSKNINKAKQRLCELASTADIVFHVGVCGALDEALKIGDAVICRTVMMNNESPVELPFGITSFNRDQRLYRSGIYVTADRFVGHEEKKMIREKFPDACCVDMESYVIARVVLSQNPNVVIVKSVSDSYKTVLPDESFLIKNFRQKNIVESIKTILSHPLRSKRVLELKWRVWQAARANARIVDTLTQKII
jgi:nucleoside phosphorylase